MEAADDKLRNRTYNVAAMSFTPEEIARSIRRHIPNLKLTYQVCPIRQAIGKYTFSTYCNSHKVYCTLKLFSKLISRFLASVVERLWCS